MEKDLFDRHIREEVYLHAGERLDGSETDGGAALYGLCSGVYRDIEAVEGYVVTGPQRGKHAAQRIGASEGTTRRKAIVYGLFCGGVLHTGEVEVSSLMGEQLVPFAIADKFVPECIIAGREGDIYQGPSGWRSKTTPVLSWLVSRPSLLGGSGRSCKDCVLTGSVRRVRWSPSRVAIPPLEFL